MNTNMMNNVQSDKDELKECVKKLFDSYLNYIEERDSGKRFRPIEITCCRAMMLQPLDQLLTRMATLAGVERVKTND